MSAMCISAKKRYVSFVHVTRVTSTFLQSPSMLQYLGAMAAKKETAIQEHFNRTTNWDILATVGIFLNNTSGEFPAVEDKTRSFPILKSTVPTFIQAIGLISFCQCLMRPFPPLPFYLFTCDEGAWDTLKGFSCVGLVQETWSYTASFDVVYGIR